MKRILMLALLLALPAFAAQKDDDFRAAQAAESAMNDKFERAKEAFNNNAFASAKNGFGQVTSGSHQAEAQAYLQKIQQYEQFMQQGESAAGGKNYQAAMSAYQNAANIKGDGHGDPNGKLSSVRMMSSASAQPQQQPQQIQPPPPRPVVSAVVAPTKKVDIQALLRKAQ